MRLLPFAALSILALAIPAAAQAPAGAPRLAFPLACRIGHGCEVQHYFDHDPGPGMADYHCGRRSEPAHNAIDIRLLDLPAMRKGVDVLAAAAGRVIAVRDGVPDNVPGQAIPSAQQCGNRVGIVHGGGWITDYCHLEHGTLKVKMGDVVAQGQPIAQVGMSGGTEFPHLHMSLQHGNTFVDPFAPAPGPNPTCAPKDPLWTPAALAELVYRPGQILEVGLSGDRGAVQRLDEGGGTAPHATDPVMVIFVRGIELEAGDQMELRLIDPKGAVVADQRAPPLPRDKDQYDIGLTHARPAAGWGRGVYVGEARLWRAGKLVDAKKAQATL